MDSDMETEEGLPLEKCFSSHDGITFSIKNISYDRIMKFVPNVEIRDTDVVILSFFKSGTWWMKYILAQMYYGTEITGKVPQVEEMAEYFEFPVHHFHEDVKETDEEQLFRWSKTKQQRIFVTHLHRELVPPGVREGKCKVIMLVRNPKDILVSGYSFFTKLKAFTTFKGTFQDFYHWFKDYGCHMGSGPYTEFYKTWWSQRNNIPMLVVHYEDMKRDLVHEITRVADFLQKPLKAEIIEEIAQASYFDNMKTSPTAKQIQKVFVESFFRKGKVGDWKNTVTVEQSEAIDEWIERELGGTGMTIKYS